MTRETSTLHEDALQALEGLEASPLAALHALQAALPISAHAILREAPRILQLSVGAGDVAAAAAALLECASHHTFEWRGRTVEYWELPDADSDLLYGNVLWPCAELLSRMLIESADGAPGLWNDSRCDALGVSLSSLVKCRFGLDLCRPPPDEADAASPLPRLGGTHVLEIGCGVGLCGLVCRECGAHITLSDGEARLVEALRSRHGHKPKVDFLQLDWRQEARSGAAMFDVVLGSDVLHPRCAGEIHAPRLISERLARKPDARAILVSEVRRVQTCRAAVDALRRNGLRVSTFLVVQGGEFFPARLESAEIGSTVLIAARWDLSSEAIPLHVSNASTVPIVAPAAKLHRKPVSSAGVGGLHSLIKGKATEEELLSQLLTNPHLASEVDADGMLPLHQAARRKWSGRVVLSLLGAWPSGASSADRSGRLPLHWAAERRAPADAIAALLASHPQGAMEPDADGQLPLHCAVCGRLDAALLDSLLAAAAEAASWRDRSGRIALHYAAARKASTQSISLLLGAHPQGVAWVDADGMTPTALARAHRAPADAVSLLSAAADAQSAVAATTDAPAVGSYLDADHEGTGSIWPGETDLDDVDDVDGLAVEHDPLLQVYHNRRLDAPNVWEVNLPRAPLVEAKRIFDSGGLNEVFRRLRSAPERSASHITPAGQHFFAVRAGGQGARWHSDLVWISADDALTFSTFDGIFRQMRIPQKFSRYVDHADSIRLFSAFFVVRTTCSAADMHVDYARGVGTNALTLMTPLADYSPRGSFQLLYEGFDTSIAPPSNPAAQDAATSRPSDQTAGSHVKLDGVSLVPTTPMDPKGPSYPLPQRYCYREGKAIVFGARFRHSTEPGQAETFAADGVDQPEQEPHAFLCFTFGSDKPEHWPLISETIGSQSRLHARPDGELVRSK